jgi:hypothetical protein
MSDKTTLGALVDRIRAAYGLPVTDGLTDDDFKVIDVLNEMREIGIRVGKREASKALRSTKGDEENAR